MPVICFKRWKRAGYAIFASLHKAVKIGVVTFICTLVQNEYQKVFAQYEGNDSTKYVKLSDVEITGSQPRLWPELARSISVIGQPEIASSPAIVLEDILEQAPGLDVRQRGSDGVQSDLSIRGGSSDQVLILLNGVNITDPQTGHHNLNFPVDLSQIQRIEILQGSGARLLGPSAFSGAINIITYPSGQNNSKGSPISGRAELGAGSFNRQLQSGSISFFKNSLNLDASLSHRASDGYISNTDYDIINSTFDARYSGKKAGDFLLQLGYQQKGFGANSFYSFAYPNQYEATKTLLSSFSWEMTKCKVNYQVQLYHRQHHDRFELFRNMENAASWYTGHNYHQTDVTGADLRLSLNSVTGKTVIGSEARNEHIFSNVLGNQMSTTKTDYLDPDALFTKEKNRVNYRAYLDHTIFIDKISISAGISGNYNTDFGAYWYGGADAGYALSGSSKIFINFNQAVRLPSFTDLYYKSATQIANPDLKPEKSATIEIGASHSGKKLKADLSAWYREGSNIIDWIKYPDSTKWVSRNLTKVDAAGLDLKTSYIFGGRILKSINFSYSFQNLDKKAEGFDSKYALDYLRHKANLNLCFKVFENKKYGNIGVTASKEFQDRSGNYTDFKTGKITDYKPFYTSALRILWEKGNFAVTGDVTNITDTKYADFGGLIQPGRAFNAGITYKF